MSNLQTITLSALFDREDNINSNPRIRCIRDYSANFTDKFGVTRTAPANTLRFDYDSNGIPKGVLLDPHEKVIIDIATPQDQEFFDEPWIQRHRGGFVIEASVEDFLTSYIELRRTNGTRVFRVGVIKTNQGYAPFAQVGTTYAFSSKEVTEGTQVKFVFNFTTTGCTIYFAGEVVATASYNNTQLQFGFLQISSEEETHLKKVVYYTAPVINNTAKLLSRTTQDTADTNYNINTTPLQDLHIELDDNGLMLELPLFFND